MKLITGLIISLLTFESNGDPFRSFGVSVGLSRGSGGSNRGSGGSNRGSNVYSGGSGGSNRGSNVYSGGSTRLSQQTSSYGSNNGGFSGSTRSSSGGQGLQQGFASTGVVPNDLAEVPPAPVNVILSSGKSLSPGQQTSTSELDVMPTFKWETEPGALYTLLIEDNNLSTRPDSQFGHLLVANIPGNNVRAGEDILSHVPSFAFEQNEAKDKLDTETLTKKPHLVLVYKQNGRINVPDAEKDIAVGCKASTFGNRFGYFHDDLKEKYNLEGPVAGTYYTVTYEPGWAEYWICYASAIIGNPIPFLLEGINDKERGQCSACQKPKKYKNRWYYKRIPYIPLVNRN